MKKDSKKTEDKQQGAKQEKGHESHTDKADTFPQVVKEKDMSIHEDHDDEDETVHEKRKQNRRDDSLALNNLNADNEIMKEINTAKSYE